MAKQKSECPLAIAKGVAKMKEQSVPTEWKAVHTATLMRYVALDILTECKCPEQVRKDFSTKLKAVLEATPALCESSNLAKRLSDWGEIKASEVAYE